MKILITGAQGQVGSAVVEKFSRDSTNEVFGLDAKDMDISSRTSVFNAISQLQPDVVVNAAAMTNVDACETNVDQAFAINALGVRNLAQACDSVDAQLIHLSTDFVFDGELSRPYSEFDVTNPLSVYATSKLGGDNEALSYSRGTVLRLAWVFGNPQGDFFSWVTDGVKEGTISALIDDQVGTPTYSYDVAMVVHYCATHRLNGLFNVANGDETTRLAMGIEVCERLGIEHNLVGITAESLHRPATRPNYSALSTSTLTQTTGIVMRSWQEALDEHLSRLNAKA